MPWLGSPSPAVDLCTRGWLLELERSSDVLDEGSRELVERALDRALEVTLAGFVFRLALALGAERDRALEAASFAELFYAGCSTVDDVQDGEAGDYLGELPPALRVNAAFMLLTLAMARLGELCPQLVAPCFLRATAMLTGQRLELLRQGWSVETYRRVARLSAGSEIRVMVAVAAVAAGLAHEPLEPAADALGELIQIETDRRTGDPRLLALPAREVAAYEAEVRGRLARALEAWPAPGREVVLAALARPG